MIRYIIFKTAPTKREGIKDKMDGATWLGKGASVDVVLTCYLHSSFYHLLKKKNPFSAKQTRSGVGVGQRFFSTESNLFSKELPAFLLLQSNLFHRD